MASLSSLGGFEFVVDGAGVELVFAGVACEADTTSACGARGYVSSFLCPFALAITLCMVVELWAAFLVLEAPGTKGLGARRVDGGVGLLLGLALIALLLVEAHVVLERDHLRLQCGDIGCFCFLRRTAHLPAHDLQ